MSKLACERGDKYSPFPEEMESAINRWSEPDLYFAPTLKSKENLIKDKSFGKAYLCHGRNTAIDAMKNTLDDHYVIPVEISKGLRRRIVSITMHRRENEGAPMYSVFEAIHKSAYEYPDTQFIFPTHKNPAVRKAAKEILGEAENISLIEPLDVVDFHNYAKQSYLILTDSGRGSRRGSFIRGSRPSPT